EFRAARFCALAKRRTGASFGLLIAVGLVDFLTLKCLTAGLGAEFFPKHELLRLRDLRVGSSLKWVCDWKANVWNDRGGWTARISRLLSELSAIWRGDFAL